MNIDTLIFIVLGAFFVIGFVRGFIREIGAIFGFFIALALANTYYPSLVPAIKPSLAQWPIIQEPLSLILAYFGAFIIAQVVIGIAVRLLDFFIKHFAPIPFLKTANRLAGGALGAVEGILLLSAIFYMITMFPLNKDWDAQIKKSALAGQIMKVSGLIKPFLPDFSKFTPQFFPGVNADDGKKQNAGQYDFLKNFNVNSIKEKDIPPEYRALFKQLQEYQKK